VASLSSRLVGTTISASVSFFLRIVVSTLYDHMRDLSLKG
jgi:hypothetical protein